MTGSGEERRTQARIKQNSFLKLNGKLALLMDISLNGIKLAAQEVPDNMNIKIKIGIMEQDFLLEGKIMWFSNKNDFSGLYEMGVYIEKPTKLYEKLVNKFLASSNKL